MYAHTKLVKLFLTVNLLSGSTTSFAYKQKYGRFVKFAYGKFSLVYTLTNVNTIKLCKIKCFVTATLMGKFMNQLLHLWMSKQMKC